MNQIDDPLEDRVHALLRPLRDQRVRVSQDFGRNVIDQVEAGRGPAMVDVLGGFLLDSINAVSPDPRGTRIEDEESDDE